VVRTEFRFCPSCGTPLKSRWIEEHDLPACLQCDFIAWRGPKAAVALVASDPLGRLLAIRRGISPGLGGWAFPGGYVDDEEDPAVSAVRECREETGCESVVEALLGVFHVVTEEGGLLVLAYRGQLISPEPVPSPEAPELRLFDPQELPPLVFSSHRRALAAWHAGSVVVN